MLRGTVYLINGRMATDEHTPIARMIVDLDVSTAEMFQEECNRRAAMRPTALSLEAGNVVEFGPIAPRWSR